MKLNRVPGSDIFLVYLLFPLMISLQCQHDISSTKAAFWYVISLVIYINYEEKRAWLLINPEPS